MNTLANSKKLIVGLSLTLILLGSLSVYTWYLHEELAKLRLEISQSDLDQTKNNPRNSSPFSPLSTNPFAHDPFAQLRQSMDNLMHGNGFANSTLGAFGHPSPTIHVDETGPDYLIRIEVPEHQELELNTEVDGDLFRVSGIFRYQEDLAGDGSKVYRSSESRFSRSFMLREEVDESKMVIENAEKEVIIRLPKVA